MQNYKAFSDYKRKFGLGLYGWCFMFPGVSTVGAYPPVGPSPNLHAEPGPVPTLSPKLAKGSKATLRVSELFLSAQD